jgi:release factor glutamine methyltransferase
MCADHLKKITLDEAYAYLVDHLNSRQGTPRQIARMLLEDLFGVANVHTARELNRAEWNKVLEALERLNQGEPLQYVTEIAHFYGLKFRVNRSVLIPRPETEELVFAVIGMLKKDLRKDLRILDIGTGSGCIGLTIKHFFPGAQVTLMDKSKEALEVCHSNSERLNSPVTLILDDITTPSASEIQEGKWHYIVSNPPYIRESEKADMERHVLDFEPADALFPLSKDPLRMYAVIINYSCDHLLNDGYLFLELNEFLAKEIRHEVIAAGFRDVEMILDMQGKERILKAQKK